jgi:cytochrome P450
LLVVSDPEIVKQIFTAPPEVLRAGDGNRRALEQGFGEHSLILLDGDLHMNHRRLLLPALHGRRLERQEASMRTLAQAHIDSWPMDEELAMLPLFRALVLEVVLQAVVSSGGDGQGTLRGALHDLLLPAPLTVKAVQSAEGSIEEEIIARRAGSTTGGHDDILSLLIDTKDESGSPLSNDEIRDELTTLIVVGTGTTASSLAWTMERLARAPQALARATEDAREGGGPYLDAVIYETLRMRPPVPIFARLVARDWQMGSHSVAAGTVIAVSVLLIHHRADIYEEPETFRPERFLESKPGTYTWIPFGGGVRRCIGASFALLEMQIVLSALLTRMAPEARDPEPEAMRRRLNTIVPAGDARVVFSPHQ